MEISMKQLLETYYQGITNKLKWESVIADDFHFVGGDMTKPEPLVGKDQYIAVIARFSNVFKTMGIKQMIVEGENACVIANYDYTFPNGKEMIGNVAEIWTSKNGKLQSLTIFFDTLAFANNT